MAKTSKGQISLKKHGSPKAGTNRRVSSPQSGDEAAQMIADDIESEVLAYLNRMTMERAINRMDMRTVLGVGGPDLEQYEDLTKEGFASAIEDGDPVAPYGMNKDDRPILNQISNEIELKPTIKSGGADTVSEADKKTKRRRGK